MLLIKAIIPGGAATDLFAVPVEVGGYTNRAGTFVGPHTAIRHKRVEQPHAQPANPAEPQAAAPSLTPLAPPTTESVTVPQGTSFSEATAGLNGPFTAEQVAERWPGHTADEVMDHLHANAAEYATLPGGRWMRMQDYLDTQNPAEAMQHVMDAAAEGAADPHLKARLEKQAVALAAQGVRNAAEAMEPPAQGPGEAELSDDPSSPNYRYRDTGYVAGSRKEMASTVIRRSARNGQQVLPTQIDWDELEQNPREAKELITKSNLFGQVPWEQLREGGMEPGAGFLIDRVYASVAPQPSEDTPQTRQDYALGLQTLRARLEACKTPDEVRNTIEDIQSEYDGKVLTTEESTEYANLGKEAQEIYEMERVLDDSSTAAYKGSQELSAQIWPIKREIENRKARGWAPKPELDQKLADVEARYAAAWSQFSAIRAKVNPLIAEMKKRREVIGRHRQIIMAGAVVRNKLENPLHRAWNTMGERFVAVLRYRSSKGSDAFAKHVAAARAGKIKDWSWAETEGATRAPRITKESTRFQLTIPDKFERVGGRPLSVESTTALKDAFGLREVQSGNWVLRDQASAKWHTEQAAAGFADLADVIGALDHQVAFNGRLALAFGARGHGSSGFAQGAPAAHYEPVHRIINVTKMKGGGTLAHEWLHGLDNLVSEAATGQPAGSDAMVTENPELLPAGPLRDAVVNLRAAMFDGQERETEALAYTERDVQTAKRNLDGAYVNVVARKIKAAPDVHTAVRAIDEHFAPKEGEKQSRKQKQLNRDWRQLAAAYHGDRSGKPSGTIDVMAGPGMSRFALNAARLDDGGTTYWSTGREMAARAFQSYVEDRLAGMGRRNDYLSAYADNKWHMEGKPYPEGDERARINAAYDALFAALRDTDTLAKAMELLA